MDSVLAALKFRTQTFLARPLALAAYDRHAELLTGHDLIVPVPLHWTRQFWRGFNQAEALAFELSRLLGTPLRVTLKRSRGSAQSRTAFKDRARNVRRTFSVSNAGAEKLKSKKVLLVDDVTTTGSTLNAATQALLKAGASSVTGFALLRTPDPRESED